MPSNLQIGRAINSCGIGEIEGVLNWATELIGYNTPDIGKITSEIFLKEIDAAFERHKAPYTRGEHSVNSYLRAPSRRPFGAYTINIPDTRWNAALEPLLAASGFVKSYSYYNPNSGNHNTVYIKILTPC